jgi:RimJ/RimL family protein N-acetyltransferase
MITLEPFNMEDAKQKSWVDHVIKPSYSINTRGIVAIREDASIAGGIIMTNWSHNSVHVHVGAETPFVFKYGLHAEAARYIYNVAQRDVILGFTPADNEKAIKLNKHLGLREIGRLPNAYKRGVDYVILCMRRDECSYLENQED